MKRIGFSVLLMLAGQSISAETTANFRVQATIANGCSLSNVEQRLDFDRQSAVGQGKVTGAVINTAQSWNIRCTERLPVQVMLSAGDYFSNNSRRMKHAQQNEFVSYQLYQNSNFQNEYTSGNSYSLTPTSTSNTLLDFAIYGVADLNNNNQARSAGLYKDTVAITITW